MKGIRQTMGPRLRAAGLLLCWGLLLVLPTARGAAQYPPPGTAEPGAPCARRDAPEWTRFFCSFFTRERWVKAGRPDFIDPSGKHWQPWFYGQEGLTNQFLIEGQAYQAEREGWLEALFDVEAFNAETYEYFWDLFRYTPWSVQFRLASRCAGGQTVNPYAFDELGIQRQHLLGLGWEGTANDTADPTRELGDGAMLVLTALADLDLALAPEQRRRLQAAGGDARAEVNAMAEGRGAFWPDYDRDAEVWLIERDGTRRPLENLDGAAEQLVRVRLLVTNDALHGWEDGYAEAAALARERGPLLYIYFAQDAFSPVDDNAVYRQRLQYLIDQAGQQAVRAGVTLDVISHGRSAGITAGVTAGHPEIRHRALGPVPGPWGRDEYARAREQGGVDIDTGVDEVLPRLGYGIDSAAGMPCLDGKTPGRFGGPARDHGLSPNDLLD